MRIKVSSNGGSRTVHSPLEIYTAIEEQPILFNKFISSTPRKILVSLSTIKIEDASSLTEF